MSPSNELWPPLPYQAWKDTYETLHMWSQVIGKVAVALAPPLNHGWGIALHLTARGLATMPLTHGQRTFTMEFDLLGHELVVETSDGARRTLKLATQSVADFYRAVMALLREMSLPVRIWPVPVEIPDPIPFEQDTQHASYDPEAAKRFWQILVQVERVFTGSRCTFVGKSSPAHFFWGSFDLAVTRFSGRPAPPREGPAFMREAYSHEVISHGFWPGNATMPEALFYAYAVPQPEGLDREIVEPAQARWDTTLSEFVLPYEAVRTAADPAGAIEAFVQSTYDRAATLARWDRDALERPRPAEK